MKWLFRLTRNQPGIEFLTTVARRSEIITLLSDNRSDNNVSASARTFCDLIDRLKVKGRSIKIINISWMVAGFTLLFLALLWPAIDEAIWPNIHGLSTGFLEATFLLLAALTFSQHRKWKSRQTGLEDLVRQSLYLSDALSVKAKRLSGRLAEENLTANDTNRNDSRQRVHWWHRDSESVTASLYGAVASSASEADILRLAILLKDAGIKFYSYSWVKALSIMFSIISALAGVLILLDQELLSSLIDAQTRGRLASVMLIAFPALFFRVYRSYSAKQLALRVAVAEVYDPSNKITDFHQPLVRALRRIDTGVET